MAFNRYAACESIRVKLRAMERFHAALEEFAVAAPTMTVGGAGKGKKKSQEERQRKREEKKEKMESKMAAENAKLQAGENFSIS